MDFRKVLTLARREKTFVVMENEDGNRFCNIDGAAYCIDGLPVMSVEEIKFLTGISTEKGARKLEEFIREYRKSRQPNTE